MQYLRQKKLKEQDEISVPSDPSVEYRTLNFITKCKICDRDVKIQTASERGLGFKIVLLCDKCADRNINSCPFVAHSYEVNRRFFAMRVLGKGLKGAAKFCGLTKQPVTTSMQVINAGIK